MPNKMIRSIGNNKSAEHKKEINSCKAQTEHMPKKMISTQTEFDIGMVKHNHKCSHAAASL